MKYEDFTQEMRQDIINAVKDKLLKLGVKVDDVLIDKFISPNDDKEYIRIATSTFNTTPTIYKSICVKGNGCLTEVKDHPNVYDLCITIDYRFEYFNGGSNGVTIGTFHFRVFQETMRVACFGLTI